MKAGDIMNKKSIMGTTSTASICRYFLYKGAHTNPVCNLLQKNNNKIAYSQRFLILHIN